MRFSDSALFIGASLVMNDRFVEPLAVGSSLRTGITSTARPAPIRRHFLLLAPLAVAPARRPALKSADVEGGPTLTMTLRGGGVTPAPRGGARELLDLVAANILAHQNAAASTIPLFPQPSPPVPTPELEPAK